MHFRTALILFLLTASPASAVIIDGIAAIVNDDVVTRSEVDSVERLGLHLSGLSNEGEVLQERIDHHLVLQQLIKQPPLAITDEEVNRAIESFAQQHGGLSKLQEFLISIGMNYADFKKEVHDQLAIRRFVSERFRPFVNITIEDAEKYYNEVFKPNRQRIGQTPPPFAESFEEIQSLLVESQVQDKIKEWLADLRRTATINIK